MIVWLTDSVGPGNDAGVTDDPGRALSDAERLLTEGRAVSVRVESASAHPGGCWLDAPYERSGVGWTAACGADGSVRWTPFYRPRSGGVVSDGGIQLPEGASTILPNTSPAAIFW